MCELVVAKTNAYLGQGSIRKLQRGVTILCADHPVAKQSPQLFEPLTVAHYCDSKRASGAVEQATAEPGELRTTTPRRGRKKAEAAEPSDDQSGE